MEVRSLWPLLGHGQGLGHTREGGSMVLTSNQGQLLAWADCGDQGILGGTENYETKQNKPATPKPHTRQEAGQPGVTGGS